MTDRNIYNGPNRVFSGVQPSGDLHLGNYLGALKKFVKLQDEMECIYCIVDLHAITVWQDPKKLAEQTRHIAAAYLASGVDPTKAIVYNQSSVRAHSELAWYFNCVARIGWLNRMTQFKDKAGKNSEKMSVGLYNYPVLQAADILAFKATHVPVGEDQKQHLELTRDIAAKFNHDFSSPNFFPLCEPLIKGPGARVMSLRDGTEKMSKSDPSDNSRINLTDDADKISKKIRKAKTDAGEIPLSVDELEGRPEVKNLLNIFSSLSEVPILNILNNYAGKQFSDFKKDLSDLLIARLEPIRNELIRIEGDNGYLRDVLEDGAIRANEKSERNIKEIRKIIGLG